MKISIILILLAQIISSGDFKIYQCLAIKNSPIMKDGKLHGQIISSNELPQELYGTWSVTSTLKNTDTPTLFRSKSSDIWQFSKAGDKITLSNPTTGAQASINVTEVKGKTAIFTRERN
ncbi:MAG: hypothetical protein MZU97_02210 [Bacillus subtilis]|nr:hypothetical protein [Bacillus subtilis]